MPGMIIVDASTGFKMKVNEDGSIDANVVIDGSDIEIGSVELKNATTDDRANILPANTARTTGTIVLATQSIDAAGAVLSTSALATSAKQDTGNTSLGSILTSVDGLETLVGTTNTTLSTIDGHIDGIEGSVDGIETLIGTTNTNLVTIDGRVDGIEAALTTLNGTDFATQTTLATIQTDVANTADDIADLLELLETIGTVDAGTGSTKTIVAGAQYNATPPTLTDAQQASLQLDSEGNLKTTSNILNFTDLTSTDNSTFLEDTSKGLPILGQYQDSVTDLANEKAGAVRITAQRALHSFLVKSDGSQFGIEGQPISVQISQTVTGNGPSVYREIDLDVTGQVVKASAAQLTGWYIINTHATALRYLKIYDKATAADENDTPLMTIPIPPGPSGANLYIGVSIPFSNGISVRATTGVADNDTGATGTNEVIVNLFFV